MTNNPNYRLPFPVSADDVRIHAREAEYLAYCQQVDAELEFIAIVKNLDNS